MENDYSKEPTSLTEGRALKNNSTADWTPRDVLVHMLRGIDNGKFDITGICVCYFCDRGKQYLTGAKFAQLTTLQVVGLLEAVKHDQLRGD